MKRKLFLLYILSWFFLPSIAHSQRTDTIKPIEPPFGLTWGENEENVKKWIKDNDFPSTKGKTKFGRYAIEADGPFPNAEFNRIRFYFGKRGLDEVELQFNEIGPKNDKIQEFELFTKTLAIKDKIDRELGKGQRRERWLKLAIYPPNMDRRRALCLASRFLSKSPRRGNPVHGKPSLPMGNRNQRKEIGQKTVVCTQ
jgi:hypothetical protein